MPSEDNLKFDSKDNLQISEVKQTSGGVLFFRGYGKSPLNQTITDKTYIIRGIDGRYDLLREIDEEIIAIDIFENETLIAIGHLGNVYEYAHGRWNDRAYTVDPVNILIRAAIHEGVLYAVGTEKTFIRLTESGWVSVCSQMNENEDIDLYGCSPSGDGSFSVCGSDGCLEEVSSTNASTLDIPTNLLLTNLVHKANQELAVCGHKGTFFVGDGERWKDYSQPDLGVDFTGIANWKGDIFVSAMHNVLKFHDGKLVNVGNVQSFNLIPFNDSLWSIGINSLHRYDGHDWNEVRVTIPLQN